MSNQATKVVIAAPTFQSVLHTEMCEHLKKWLKPEEMALRSVTGETDTQKTQLARALAQLHPTALIAISLRPDPDTIAAYAAADVPIIVIDEDTTGVSTITTDNYMGGRIAGEYLASKGRKKIAIVTGRTQVKGGYNAEQRLHGFQHALATKGISMLPGCVIEVVNYTREDGVQVMPKLIDLGVDAIFCAAGDNCAIGLLTAAKERGVLIPEAIAIVGFDDLLIAQVSTPKLTTIKQPLLKMADAAYKMAVVHRAEILRKPQKSVFNPELIIRQSA